MWQGTLNESLGDTFTLEGDKEYIVFQTHGKKQKSRF
jgi:thiamine pyrophosphokinase